MNNRTRPSILQDMDTDVAMAIAKSRGISLMDALRLFLASETHEMLLDDSLKLWYFSPLDVQRVTWIACGDFILPHVK